MYVFSYIYLLDIIFFFFIFYMNTKSLLYAFFYSSPATLPICPLYEIRPVFFYVLFEFVLVPRRNNIRKK